MFESFGKIKSWWDEPSKDTRSVLPKKTAITIYRNKEEYYNSRDWKVKSHSS